MCSTSSNHCHEPDACWAQYDQRWSTLSADSRSRDAAAAAAQNADPTPWLEIFALRKLELPNAFGMRLAISYPIVTALTTSAPLNPRVSARLSATATIDGPGCTKADGMKSLISAPWPAIAPANARSTMEAFPAVPAIVAAAGPVLPPLNDRAYFRASVDGSRSRQATMEAIVSRI